MQKLREIHWFSSFLRKLGVVKNFIAVTVVAPQKTGGRKQWKELPRT
jgi:hypothetical protein